MAKALSENVSPPFIKTETIGRAVDALIKWIKSQPKHGKAQLLEHEEFFYLTLTLKKIPSNPRTNPYKILLPNPVLPSPLEICLIIDDRSRSGLTSESAKKKIDSESIPISKVLKITKLKSDYRPFEAKRQLCGSYDLFFTDKRVVPVLPRLLGKQFFKKKKIPIPIDLRHKNWKEQIEQACGSALLYLRTGTCCTLKVGKLSMGRDEVVENVVAAIAGAVEVVPKKWANVRSFHLRSLDSLALPIYQVVPEMGLKIEAFKEEVIVPKLKNGPEVAEEKEESEKRKEKESEKKKKKKVSKKGRIHEVRYMDGDINALMAKTVDDDGINDGDAKGGNAELSGNKNKNKRKKTAVTEELSTGHMDGDIDDLVMNADDGIDGVEVNGGAAEMMGKKKSNKKKKAAAMDELDGGTLKKSVKVKKGRNVDGGHLHDLMVNADDGMDGGEVTGGDAEIMSKKKSNKKKASAMEELEVGTLKVLAKVKKVRNVEVNAGLSSSDGVKKRSKDEKPEEKKREGKKKATKIRQ
ncbi:putative ribosome biogenesis protein C8F11.04 [Magnolia sinica]|uniref:putative ribosome biogenesis protein C8F11.04 n=1 Tax=Magnolia sinica TaxID=86752 RepID=UPI002657FEBE|nr:putative ribosome biogenesis protein C8F11.04 [Magnolia sinica]